MHPGCGVQLAYQLLKALNQTWVTTRKASDHFLEGTGLLELPDPAASGLPFVFADDWTTRETMDSLLKAPAMLYVCANISGTEQFARILCNKGYAATASLSNIDDLNAKLNKAAAMQGFRFLEILAPCPTEWLSDASNTVELCRQAVESGIWPLCEIEKGRITVSYKPLRLQPVQNFLGLQKRPFSVDRARLEKSWRALLAGRITESGF